LKKRIIPETVKRDIIKKNFSLAKKAFGVNYKPMYREEFIRLVRELCHYSPKTIDLDIAMSWGRVYKSVNFHGKE